MKILHVGQYHPQNGGPSHGTRNIARHQSAMNDVIVIHPDDKRRWDKQWMDGSVRVERQEIPFKRFTSLQKAMVAAKAAWRHKNADIYHIHDPMFSGIGFVDRKTVLILHIHGYPSLEAIIRGRVKDGSAAFKMIRAMEKWSVRRADMVIAVDSTIAKWASKTLGVSHDKLRIIPNGVDTMRFSSAHTNGHAVRKRLALEKEKLVVSVRRFTPKNGVENVLSGFMRYIEDHGDDVHFLMAGGGELFEELQRRVREAGHEKQITLWGQIPYSDVPAVFSSADVLVNSFSQIPFVEESPVTSVKSALENKLPICTSLTTLECLASGTPTILSTVGGKYTGVDFSDMGVVVSDNEPSELSTSLKTIFENQEKARAMGERAVDYVRAKRDWKIIASHIQEIYLKEIG